MSFEISGKLIEKYDTVVISDRFKKRELVLEKKESTPNGFEYVETIKFQLTQDKCDSLDSFKIMSFFKSFESMFTETSILCVSNPK